MEQVVRSLPQACRIIGEMNLYGGDPSDYRRFVREALSQISEDRMGGRIERHLEEMDRP